MPTSSFNSRTPGGVRRLLELPLMQEQYVSIHAPREGCDGDTEGGAAQDEEFQFTHPGRGATTEYFMMVDQRAKFQFTHPGRGATLTRGQTVVAEEVSIHAPREGCDGIKITYTDEAIKFQFTHPGRGATLASEGHDPQAEVSIHAPREGCDVQYLGFGVGADFVSIHAPREGCDGRRG